MPFLGILRKNFKQFFCEHLNHEWKFLRPYFFNLTPPVADSDSSICYKPISEIFFNPFQVNIFFLYPLETSKNFWFSGIFRGVYKEKIDLKYKCDKNAMQIYSDEFDGKSWIWRMVSEGDTMEWQYVQLSMTSNFNGDLRDHLLNRIEEN